MAPRPTRNPIISFLTNADALSVQMSKLPLDPSDVKEHIAKFDTVITPSSQIMQSFAKMYHRSQGSGFDIKMKTFGTNSISLFNETTKHVRLDGHIQLISSKVVPIKLVPQTADRIELITRISFGLMNSPNWILQIDLVKELNNPLEFASKLTSAKKQLVDVPLETMSSSAYDFVITTLVQIDREPTTQQQIVELVDSLNGETVVDLDYQDAIFAIAKDIYRDATTISKFKRQSGFKRLCPNPVELNRPLFFKQVLPHIDTFYITDKMDGTHAVLVIDEIFRRSGHKRHFLGANIYAVSDRIYEINQFSKPSTSTTIETDHTVLDVEMMEDSKGNKTFHCFDIIAIASQRVVGLPFYKRFEKFQDAQTLLEKYDLGSIKEFVKLDDTYTSQIKAFYEKKRSYHIDGIIFTPAGQFYKDAIKARTNRFDRIFNTEYSNTISFKWKPLDQLTIDFYFMKPPKQKDTYILCCGIDRKTFEQLKLSFFDGYEPPKTPNSHKYFPIQFETYDGEFDYHWKPSAEDNALLQTYDHSAFDTLVGEFKFADAKGRLTHPKLIRLRTDRAQDIAKGEYYGNALRYAELIWHSIQYPLTIKDMCEATNSGYFAADDTSDWYKPSRSFNSFAKTHLLETYLPAGRNSRIMDIAAGRGQDLARAIDLGYSEIVALDKDTDALSELLDRKYNLRVKTKNASANVHIKQIDLERSAEENAALLKLPKESADSAMINFAIHYICHSATVNQKEPLIEFAKLCSMYLKKGGKLMITAFNGADVFDKLKATSEWSIRDGDRVKYSIKRAFSSDGLTNLNQAIDVLLPFSAGNYYREYLVNYEYVQSVFESNGFKLIKTDSFSSLLRLYKKNNSKGYQDMSTGDKEYVSLYGYMIFEKI
jgi:SAM-dependent methyltransferase